MKKSFFPITAFILAQLAGITILVLWIVWSASGPSHVWWMIQGILLMFLVIVGVTTVFVSYTKSRRLDAERVNFISSISHELLTPLSSLRLYLETMQLRRLDDEQRARFLTRMLGDIDRLSDSITSLLGAARIESAKQLYHFEVLEIAGLVKELLETNRELERDAKITLDFELDVYARVDKESFSNALKNVVANSIRYSNGQANVEISLNRRGKWAFLTIKDQGDGVEPSELKRIFKLFYRSSSNPVGTGLGLYIVQKVIRAHKGKVWAQSQGSGEGLCVNIRIPVVENAKETA